jgi:hypothetical protein
VGENCIAGDVVFPENDGLYWKADADSINTMLAVAIVMQNVNANNVARLMTDGPYREDSRWNWVLGSGVANALYVHTVAGDIVQYANRPSGVGDVVQVVGWVIDADTIYFKPSLDFVVI